MATAHIRFPLEGMPGRQTKIQRRPAALRLLEAGCSQQILPLLLEEIIALGFPRALAVEADFDTGKIAPVASLKWPEQHLEKFSADLLMSSHPLVQVLFAARPVVLNKSGLHARPLYIHPILYMNTSPCQEADGVPIRECLAVQNFRGEKRLGREEQVCFTCQMRAYAAVLIVETPRKAAKTAISKLGELVELANWYRSRLFKTEHYAGRIAQMSTAISSFDRLRQERDRLTVVLQNLGDPIVVCDHEARMVLADPLARELFGDSEGAPLQAAQLSNLARLTAHISEFPRSFAGRDTALLKLFHPAQGQEIEYDVRSSKILDQEGQVSCTVSVLRDWTALKKSEQLKLERRMLEIEKFAAAGRLAATIAHEVNNPMEAIKNAVYLLAGALPETAAPLYNILKSETERVARIVRQMLGLYRNAEQVKLANVNAIIEDTLLLLQHQLQRSSMAVKTDLRALPEAVIAADQIRQVLSNLVLNSRDAMPNGGKLIIRSRHVTNPDGLRSWVRILLADTGTGIPRAMMGSIFEPFVTTKGEKGTGLGLWIVKGIIQNHGGKISVKSRPGQGTVFKIDLPVVKL